MHKSQKDKLAELQKDETPDEQQRLADAACALVGCAADLSDNNPRKAAALASQQRGAGYVTELGELQATGLFPQYSNADAAADIASQAKDWVAQYLASVGRGAANFGNAFLNKIAQNGPQGSYVNPDDLNRTNGGGGGTPPTPAVVTPSMPVMGMTPMGPAPVGATPPVVVPGTPILSSGSGGSDGAKGNVTVEPGATPDSNEIRAGQGLANLGYDVSHQPTANSQGISDVRTADLSIKGVGQIDVYTPENLDPSNIVKNIEKKASQGDGVLVQADLSSADMASIAARTWGKPNAQNLQTLFFQNSDGAIVRFNRPVIGR
ncbi:hypothetical protein [Paraburkholderia caffeinilytica]